jgi:hypothetical protein
VTWRSCLTVPVHIKDALCQQIPCLLCRKTLLLELIAERIDERTDEILVVILEFFFLSHLLRLSVVFISGPNHGLWLIPSQSCLILKDPKEKSLLSEIYNGQQQRLQVIVDDLTEIEELSEVSTHRSLLFVIFFKH